MSHECRGHGLLRITVAFVICIATCLPLAAQTTSASVAGVIKDNQGAVIPGVTVTLTSATQGTVLTSVTDAQGSFFFAYVRPDTYALKASLEGFQSAERPGIVVNANDKLTIPPMELKIGVLTETVTVAGGTPEIQLRSGERAFTLQSETIQNIAVNGRSFFGLAFLVPGVVPTADAPTQVSNLSANGQRANSNNMTIDGVANIDTGDNGGNMAQTNLDAIAEFKVLTSSYQAEYGRAVGAQVQVVTKSGTQRLAGAGYWYGRRSEWNANSWWNNRNGTALPKSSRNDSGFSIGGPVFIPGVFNADRKNLFFFFNQEFQRRKDPVGETRVTVPTALERKGDFSQSVDASGNPFPYIRDYTTGLPCSAANTSGCFADGGVLGRVPANRFYAPTLAALNLYPLPNSTGNIGYNYVSQTSGSAPLNQSMVRLDYQINPRWRLTGRYMQHTNLSKLPYGIGGWSIRSNLDTIDVVSNVPGRNWLASATGVLNNTTSLEVSLGSAHNSLDHYTNNPNLTLASLQKSAGAALPLLYPSAVQRDLIPEFTFGGGRIANQPYFNTGQAPFTNFNTTYDVVANLSKIMSAHALKAGFYFQGSLKPQSAFAYFNGRYQFDNSSNNPFDSGHPFANAALGIYNTFQQASSYLRPEWRYKNVEWYLQDNWRIRNRLTLDYGFRFYFMTPQWDTTLQASNFLPGEYLRPNAVRLFQPAVVNGVRVGYDAATGTTVNSAFIGRVVPGSGDRFQGTYQGGNGIDKTLTDGNKVKLSPRLGFAYDITGEESFVARGGFGIFYDRPQGNAVFDLITNPPGLQVSTLTWGLASQIGAGTTAYNAPVSLNPNVYDWKIPTVYQWNLGLQMKLPAKFTLDVAYVGSESRNLLQQRQLNALPYGTTYLDSSQDPTRGQTCTGCSSTSPLPGGNALPTDLLRPYQGYGAIRLWEFSAFSNYKALQNTISRRFSQGLMFSFNYTRSRAKGIANDDWGGARIDGKDREANYGPLSIDRPNVFVSSFVYQTPRTTDKPWRWATNDWQISGNYRWMTGAPYGVGYNISGIGATNLTGSDQGARIIITGDTGKGYSADPYKMFNTSAFMAPGPGSNGLESPRVYMVNAPINNLDLSLARALPFGGKRRIEIRLDAFNALNHTQFSGVNTTANFSNLADRTTITNLPYNAAGELVNKTGFGTVSGVRSPRQLQLMTRISF